MSAHHLMPNIFLLIVQGIPFRTLETFSSDEIVSRYITNVNVRRTYLENVYRYLVQRKYFKLVRQLLQEKVPPLYDVILSLPNSISETLLQMIQHPLRLVSANNKELADSQSAPDPATSLLISRQCAILILSSFVDEILIPEYTKPIQLFIVPCLANNGEFPFVHLLQFLNEQRERVGETNANKIADELAPHTETNANESLAITSTAQSTFKTIGRIFNSTFAFHAFLTLDHIHLQNIKQNSSLVRNYIQVLGSFSENLRKLQPRNPHPLFKQYDMEVEADDEVESDDDDVRKIESISTAERDCLFEVITLLNDEKRAEIIIENIDNHLDDIQVLYSLCKICHSLMLYHRTAVFEFR